jgi:hypothetical protein
MKNTITGTNEPPQFVQAGELLFVGLKDFNITSFVEEATKMPSDETT